MAIIHPCLRPWQLLLITNLCLIQFTGVLVSYSVPKHRDISQTLPSSVYRDKLTVVASNLNVPRPAEAQFISANTHLPSWMIYHVTCFLQRKLLKQARCKLVTSINDGIFRTNNCCSSLFTLMKTSPGCQQVEGQWVRCTNKTMSVASLNATVVLTRTVTQILARN